MSDFRNEYIKNLHRLKKCDSGSDKETNLKQKNEELMAKFNEVKAQYREEFASGKEKNKATWNDDPTVKYAYVVFRSMDGAKLAL